MLTSTPVIHDVACVTTAMYMVSPQFITIIHVQTLHNTVHHATVTAFPPDQDGGPQRTEARSGISQEGAGIPSDS